MYDDDDEMLEAGGGGNDKGYNVATMSFDRGIAIRAGATWNQSTYTGTAAGGTLSNGDELFALVYWQSSDVSDMAEEIAPTNGDPRAMLSREFKDSLIEYANIGDVAVGTEVVVGSITSTFDVTSFVIGDISTSFPTVMNARSNGFHLNSSPEPVEIDENISSGQAFTFLSGTNAVYGIIVLVRAFIATGSQSLTSATSVFVKDTDESDRLRPQLIYS